jgi:hypothetical protein
MGKYLRISSYILGSPSSYMTLQLLTLNFPRYERKFDILFYHSVEDTGLDWGPQQPQPHC